MADHITKKREVVVVTGVSAGLSRATALAYAREGAAIGLLSRNRERLETLRQEIEQLGGRALVRPTDVADAGQVEAAAQAVEETFGPIDSRLRFLTSRADPASSPQSPA